MSDEFIRFALPLIIGSFMFTTLAFLIAKIWQRGARRDAMKRKRKDEDL
jgi:hypothetical protein